MRAIELREYGGPEALQLAEVPVPEPLGDDVLIEVHAAGFNPFDAKVRMGFLRDYLPLQLPAVLGCEFAGVVTRCGPEVRSLAIGDAVFGVAPVTRSGAYAECIAVNHRLVRRKPAALSFEQAASAPMAALTAWKGLVELARIAAGMRVLIHGGAGGVGSMAVQIARLFGAEVIATCSERNRDFALELGASRAIDYEREDFVSRAGEVDVVFDPIGGDVNRRSYEVLKRGGVMLVVLRADPVEETHRERMQRERGVTTHVVTDILQPAHLAEIARHLEAGDLRPVLTRVEPLENVAQVHAQCVTGHGRTGHARGKTVFRVR